MFEFDRYLPLLDPDEFSDASFFRELDKMGYRQVLLGGTGAGDLPRLAEEIKRETRLTVVLYPAGPDSEEASDPVALAARFYDKLLRA